MKRETVVREWMQLLGAERRADETARAWAVGHLLAKIVVQPPFNGGVCYEIRQPCRQPVRVYRSHFVPGTDHVKGYERIDIDPRIPSEFLQTIRGLQMSFVPAVSDLQSLDATSTSLAIYGELQSELRFQWLSSGPSAWTALVQETEKLTQVLRSCPDVMESAEQIADRLVSERPDIEWE